MRCLFCDKKLSLLKSATGDGFCSQEHLDAYQHEMSRRDIERVLAMTIEDAPRTPLIMPVSDHEHHVEDEDSRTPDARGS